MGKNTIGNIVKVMCEAVRIQGRKVNHRARKTAISSQLHTYSWCPQPEFSSCPAIRMLILLLISALPPMDSKGSCHLFLHTIHERARNHQSQKATVPLHSLKHVAQFCRLRVWCLHQTLTQISPFEFLIIYSLFRLLL